MIGNREQHQISRVVGFCGFPLVNIELVIAILTFKKFLKHLSIFLPVRLTPPPEDQACVPRRGTIKYVLRLTSSFLIL